MNENDDGLRFDITTESTEEDKDYYNPRELIIFAIDCTNPMFQSSGSDDSPFRVSLKCCRSMLIRKIIGSSSDYIGIIFFGTREKDVGDQHPKHVITLFGVSQPNAEVIKKIDAILKSNSDENFDNEYGHCDDYSLSDVLWRCSSLMGGCSVKINLKKIILMTCNDDPHRDSNTKRHQARKKCEDLESLRINLEVIPLKDNFNGDSFYNDILKICNRSDVKVEPGQVLMNLKDGRYRKDNKKRSLGKLTWKIGENVQLGVDLYCFYRQLRIPSIQKLHKTTNESVKSVTASFHVHTGERLLKSDLNVKIEIGNEQLAFKAEEKEKLSLHEKPGITLLGFKSMDHLTFEYHTQTASFLYPDEETFKGSTKLFKALLQKCIEKGKFALCYMVSRARSSPKLVALVPQDEVIENEVQVMPSGFHVIYLPFAGHIRNIELPTKDSVKSEEVELCKKVLKKIKLTYTMFENPKVQTHWANIEALALNYTECREVKDATMPNYEFVSQRRLQDLETKFVDVFFKNNYNPDEEATRKRKYLAYAASSQAAKLPNIDPSNPDYVIKMGRAGRADKLTVPALKQFLQEKGINVTGFKKNDLVNALYTELNMDL